MFIKKITRQTVDSPIGPLTLSESSAGLFRIDFGGAEKLEQMAAKGRIQLAAGQLKTPAARQLDEYFAGKRKVFDLPLDIEGTPFQQKIWQLLSTIPYGETRSYRDMAILADCPKGFQAVGQANGANPLPILFPCHRVLAADGTLGGYAGGLPMKVFLLELEKRYR